MDPVQQHGAQNPGQSATPAEIPTQPGQLPVQPGATNPPVETAKGKEKKKGFWASRPGRSTGSSDGGWISAGCECCAAFTTLAIGSVILVIYAGYRLRRKRHK